MVSPPGVQFVIDAWEEITAISPLFRVDRTEGEKAWFSYQPTLEKLELFMEMVDWHTAPVDRFTFYKWVCLVHRTFVHYKY
jgi:hypothetical protein